MISILTTAVCWNYQVSVVSKTHSHLSLMGGNSHHSSKAFDVQRLINPIHSENVNGTWTDEDYFLVTYILRIF